MAIDTPPVGRITQLTHPVGSPPLRQIAPQTFTRDKWVPEDLAAKLKTFNPRTEFGLYIRACLDYLPVEMAAELIERMSSIVVLSSSVRAVVYRGRDGVPWHDLWHIDPFHPDKRIWDFKVEDYGIVGWKSITDAGVGFLVDAWQNSVELENMKYHGIGTGTTAEAVTGSGSALVTELTTEYNPDSTRATGSLTEGATALVFRSVGTNTLDGTPGAAIREHALCSSATVGAGVTWDRTLMASPGLGLSSGDALQSTYDMTGTSGG